MTLGTALKANEIDKIHAEMEKIERQVLAIAKKYRITVETLRRIDRVRMDAKKCGPYAVVGVRRYKAKKRTDQAENGA
jgi:hypothetical protein